jgi:hypothetical protein
MAIRPSFTTLALGAWSFAGYACFGVGFILESGFDLRHGSIGHVSGSTRAQSY